MKTSSEICGVENDSNRKTTQKLTDCLRSKQFAGDFRPIVEVKTIQISNHQIDVICIKNNEYVPYYLTDRGKTELFPYHIYTRVQDSNTPKDKSADLVHVEMLWKRRFHLLDSPLKKMRYFLSQKDNWLVTASPDFGTVRYYRYAPEYTIKTADLEGEAVETFMLTQLDKHGSWHSLSLHYHQTMLYQTLGVLLDGGRYMTVQPSIGSFYCQRKQVFYYYLCKNSVKFALYEFFIHDEDSRDYLANQRYTEEVLFFDDEYEREDFEIYLHRNMEEYAKYVKNVKVDTHRRTVARTQDHDYQDDYDHRLALKILYQSYCDYFKNLCDVEVFDFRGDCNGQD